MSGKKKKYNLKSRIISALRRVSRWHPDNKEIKKLHRISRGLYSCQNCGGGHKKIKIDHIDPVVDPNIGFVDWNEFIERLFPGPSGLQILCESCHKIKTDKERIIRKARKFI